MRYEKDGDSTCRTFDFMPIGQAIKQAREARGITREQLAEMLDYAPRHLQAIENEGQHPSLQLFVQLVTMFDIPVDQYLFPERENTTTALRQQTDAALNRLDQPGLSVVHATACALLAVYRMEDGPAAKG